MKSITSPKNTNQQKICHNRVLEFPGLHYLTLIEKINVDSTLYIEWNQNRKLQCKKIKLSRTQEKTCLGIYQWRNNTELPIVKTHYITFTNETSEYIELDIFNEYIPKRLSDYCQIPLSQILYLMKESLIGFQRLFSKFGGFQVNAHMIGINENKKCKVWYNELFQLNIPRKKQIVEGCFASRIIDIFSSYVLRTHLSKDFFEGLRTVDKFVQAFKYIDSFASSSRISIPFRFTLEPNNQFKGLGHELTKSSGGSVNNKSEKLKISSDKFVLNEEMLIQDLGKAQTQNGYRMKNSHETTKAHSHNDIIFSFMGNEYSRDEDFEEEIFEIITPTTPSGKPLKTFKDDSIFKSDINIQTEFYGQQPKRKKQRKFSAYDQKQVCVISPQYLPLNSIQESIEQKDTLKSQEYQAKERNQVILSMFKKNGWENKLLHFTQDRNIQIKKSITITTENQKNKTIKLDKLDRLSRDIGDSMLRQSIERQQSQ